MPIDRYGRDLATLNSLPRIQYGEVKAFLSWNDGGNLKVWTFLYPIQRLEMQIRINYELNDAVATNSKDLYWRGNDPKVITLPDIILETFQDSRSIRPLLEGIEALSKATASRRSPPVLSFTCGNIRLTPCVLTGEISYTLGRFIGSEPVSARLSLQLTQVDPGQLIAPTAPPIPVGTPVIVVPQITPPVVIVPTPTPAPNPSTGTPPTAPVTPGNQAENAKGVYFLEGGTGFGVANVGADGIIASAQHMASVKTATIDGKKYNLTTVGTDQSNDVHLFRAKGVNVHVLKLAKTTTEIKPGEDVYAIGYPGGDPAQESTTGKVVANPAPSSLGYVRNATGFIQYTARTMHRGMSGGPQFLTSTNEVISVTSAGGEPRKGTEGTKDSVKYDPADNKPVGGRIEAIRKLLNNAGIKFE